MGGQNFTHSSKRHRWYFIISLQYANITKLHKHFILLLTSLDGSKILTQAYSKILRHCLLNSLKLSITFSISTQSGWDKSRSIDIKAKEDNLSWPIVLHKQFFSLFRQEKDRSHEAVVTGNVILICNNSSKVLKAPKRRWLYKQRMTSNQDLKTQSGKMEEIACWRDVIRCLYSDLRVRHHSPEALVRNVYNL